MDQAILDDLILEINAGTYGEVHSVVIIRDGKLVLERYFRGYYRSRIHAMGSCSKSITSVLMGILHRDGYVRNLDDSLLSYFPEYPFIANRDSRKNSITVRHALMMAGGFEWDEWALPYSDPNNDVVRLTRENGDWYKAALDRPMARDPGSEFVYDGMLTMLLAGIVENQSGEHAEDFCAQRLFWELGITNWHWYKSATGQIAASGGLQISAIDFAKIGYLFLNNGRWGNRQIVSENWVVESTHPWITRGHNGSYGYQWWRRRDRNALARSMKINDFYYASGYGGQFLWVVPHLDLVVVTMAGNYENGENNFNLFRDHVLPSVRDRKMEDQNAIAGSGEVVVHNALHPNGNVYDQVLLTGPSVTFWADEGQVVRAAYIDLNDDIVQVELAGKGELTIELDEETYSGPSYPEKYNQAVPYVKGHARIRLERAENNSYLGIYTIGRATSSNASLFKDGMTYDGRADIASIEIDGIGMASLLCGNVLFSVTSGKVGLDAANVPFSQRVAIGDIDAQETAVPYLRIGYNSHLVQDQGQIIVAGGDLSQSNGESIIVSRSEQSSGFRNISSSAGIKTDGTSLPALEVQNDFIDESGASTTLGDSETVIIIDNLSLGFAFDGDWEPRVGRPEYLGADFMWSQTGAGENVAMWIPQIVEAGDYEVSYWRPAAYANGATNATYRIVHALGETSYVVDQTEELGGQWIPLGVHSFMSGSDGYIVLTNEANNTSVVADAMQFRKVD